MILFTGSITIQSLHAQAPTQLYNEAYSAYEDGNYIEGLEKLDRLQKALGTTNPKIQSLRTLLYNEQGDIRNALLAAEKYFKTHPDHQSDGYQSMQSLYSELKERMKNDFNSRKDELEQQRKKELSQAENDATKESDLYRFSIAKEASSMKVWNEFLSLNSTKSLDDSAKIFIARLKQQEKQQALINEGMMLLSQEEHRKALNILQQAQQLGQLSSLKKVINEASEFSRNQAIRSGNIAILESNWVKAINEFEYALNIKKDDVLLQQIDLARQELEYENAVEKNDPALVVQYLQKYPSGIKLNHAEAYLFNYYINKGFKSKNQKDLAGVSAAIISLKEMKHAKNWTVFDDSYYELLLEHAKLIGQSNKKTRIQTIATEIGDYKELNREAGGNYAGKINRLERKQREWNRPGAFYLAYRTESTFTDLGFGVGYLSNLGLGFIFEARAPLQAWSGKTGESFEIKGREYQKGVINLIFTKKIRYPLYAYAGAGAAFINKIIPDNSEPGKGYVESEFGEITTPNAEAGLIIALKPISISGGVSMPYLSNKNKEQLGITNTPLEISIGVGIAL